MSKIKPFYKTNATKSTLFAKKQRRKTAKCKYKLTTGKTKKSPKSWPLGLFCSN